MGNGKIFLLLTLSIAHWRILALLSFSQHVEPAVLQAMDWFNCAFYMLFLFFLQSINWTAGINLFNILTPPEEFKDTAELLWFVEFGGTSGNIGLHCAWEKGCVTLFWKDCSPLHIQHVQKWSQIIGGGHEVERAHYLLEEAHCFNFYLSTDECERVEESYISVTEITIICWEILVKSLVQAFHN